MEDLINQKLTDGLFSDVNQVLPEDKFAVVAFVVVKTLAQSRDFGPGGILPGVCKHELVLDGVVYEANIAVVQASQLANERIILFIPFPRASLFRVAEYS